MSYNIMKGYDIYDCFTMEHFRLRQRMTLMIKIYCSRLYNQFNEFSFFLTLMSIVKYGIVIRMTNIWVANYLKKNVL
jgi:hypothetical protein